MSEGINTSMNILWGILIVFWIVSGFNAKKSSDTESFVQQFIYYWLPLIIAIYLLGPDERFGNSLIKGRFVAHNNSTGICGLVLCVTGLIVACRARYVLGKNWSIAVDQKVDHELILTGAYKFIRHPIYSGILLMFLGNAVIVSNWRGLVAFLVVFISFYFKLKKEEKWLTDLFGDKYREYINNSKALIPWLL